MLLAANVSQTLPNRAHKVTLTQSVQAEIRLYLVQPVTPEAICSYIQLCERALHASRVLASGERSDGLDRN